MFAPCLSAPGPCETVVSIPCGENRNAPPSSLRSSHSCPPCHVGSSAPLALSQPPSCLLPQVICCEGNAGFYEVGCVSTPLEGRPRAQPSCLCPLEWNIPIFPHGRDLPWPDHLLWVKLKPSLWGKSSPICFAHHTSLPWAVSLTFIPPRGHTSPSAASEPLVGVVSPSWEGSAPGRRG